MPVSSRFFCQSPRRLAIGAVLLMAAVSMQAQGQERLARAGSKPLASRVAAAPLPRAPEAVPEHVQDFAQRVARSGDARQFSFAVIDKPMARLWVFHADGELADQTPVIVGQAPGDETPPDIGSRPLSKIALHEKITAAGRFETEPGKNHKGEDIVWLDYHSALSMHRVRNVPGEQRLKRIQSDDVRQRRISYGCVNVPASFFDRHIKPQFSQRPGVVYVLPEQRSLAQVFPFAADAAQLSQTGPGLAAARPGS